MLSFLSIAVPLSIAFMPMPSQQACYVDGEFKKEMLKEGYSWCPDQQSLLYVKGFQRDSQVSDDLRGFKTVKCCQPPPVHIGKPHTCTSADWELSFKRFVRMR